MKSFEEQKRYEGRRGCRVALERREQIELCGSDKRRSTFVAFTDKAAQIIRGQLFSGQSFSEKMRESIAKARARQDKLIEKSSDCWIARFAFRRFAAKKGP